MTSKAAKAAAALMHLYGIKDFDHALKIYDALANTFGPVDDVLWFYETKRWSVFESMEGEEFWQSIEDCALSFDEATAYFDQKKTT
ncbi:hypothetical protein UFOVP121_74 [uncultured Caudovirales phage]|uniref:Uncharacterized protein n=1 Tax=uncultured Caudovirales phage TaxID=2100421 RepID=A0A6J5LNB7_9CAUD|nr:hypothetical protein UFOVP121_74 [uncultured Caudovirales phage]CAB4135112.1 hypothetical protein UFOVP277_79 [uncultured Caudovirales phage]